MKKLLCILMSMSCLLFSSVYAGIAPAIEPTAKNKGTAKKMLSKACLSKVNFDYDKGFLPAQGCNATFSELYAHDERFRQAMIKAFKKSPFDGRLLKVDLPSTILEPFGDAETWGIEVSVQSKDGKMKAIAVADTDYRGWLTLIIHKSVGQSKCRYGIYGTDEMPRSIERTIEAHLYVKNIEDTEDCHALTQSLESIGTT